MKCKKRKFATSGLDHAGGISRRMVERLKIISWSSKRICQFQENHSSQLDDSDQVVSFSINNEKTLLSELISLCNFGKTPV